MSFFVTSPTSRLFSITGYLRNLFVSIILSASSSFVSGVMKVIGDDIMLLTGCFRFFFGDFMCLTRSSSVRIPIGTSFSIITRQPFSVFVKSLAASPILSSFFNVGTSVNITFLTFAIEMPFHQLYKKFSNREKYNKPLMGIAPTTFACLFEIPRQRNGYYATEAL